MLFPVFLLQRIMLPSVLDLGTMLERMQHPPIPWRAGLGQGCPTHPWLFVHLRRHNSCTVPPEHAAAGFPWGEDLIAQQGQQSHTTKQSPAKESKAEPLIQTLSEQDNNAVCSLALPHGCSYISCLAVAHQVDQSSGLAAFPEYMEGLSPLVAPNSLSGSCSPTAQTQRLWLL